MDIGAVFVWLAEFFDEQFLALMIGTLLLFLLMFITWTIYRALSTRNLFTMRTDISGDASAWEWALHILRFFIFFPVLTFIGFLIFSFSLFALIRPATPADEARILFIAIIMISTIRVSAYVHELLAEDLAKLIPLSMLAILLTHPNLNLGISIAQVEAFVLTIPTVLKYLLFTVILEGVLRGGTWLFTGIQKSSDEE